MSVEWVGRLGHPSSYGLLGARLIEGETRISVPFEGPDFPKSLAARSERVDHGLIQEYRGAITAAVPAGLEITLAAHGQVSSSQAVFGGLARLILTFLRDGIPEASSDVWLRTDQALMG
jgi:hypothetical protein